MAVPQATVDRLRADIDAQERPRGGDGRSRRLVVDARQAPFSQRADMSVAAVALSAPIATVFQTEELLTAILSRLPWHEVLCHAQRVNHHWRHVVRHLAGYAMTCLQILDRARLRGEERAQLVVGRCRSLVLFNTRLVPNCRDSLHRYDLSMLRELTLLDTDEAAPRLDHDHADIPLLTWVLLKCSDLHYLRLDCEILASEKVEYLAMFRGLPGLISIHFGPRISHSVQPWMIAALKSAPQLRKLVLYKSLTYEFAHQVVSSYPTFSHSFEELLLVGDSDALRRLCWRGQKLRRLTLHLDHDEAEIFRITDVGPNLRELTMILPDGMSFLALNLEPYLWSTGSALKVLRLGLANSKHKRSIRRRRTIAPSNLEHDRYRKFRHIFNGLDELCLAMQDVPYVHRNDFVPNEFFAYD
ncbi:hypothetical protein ANO11243_067660 [Dothideomycetidae sp. 11243]|nr:hypothetical protein ANO11243_067660 [fungal sp. No.11243]